MDRAEEEEFQKVLGKERRDVYVVMIQIPRHDPHSFLPRQKGRELCNLTD